MYFIEMKYRNKYLLYKDRMEWTGKSKFMLWGRPPGPLGGWALTEG
jgi:hypothetical protein